MQKGRVTARERPERCLDVPFLVSPACQRPGPLSWFPLGLGLFDIALAWGD